MLYPLTSWFSEFLCLLIDWFYFIFFLCIVGLLWMKGLSTFQRVSCTWKSTYSEYILRNRIIASYALTLWKPIKLFSEWALPSRPLLHQQYTVTFSFQFSLSLESCVTLWLICISLTNFTESLKSSCHQCVSTLQDAFIP